MPLSRRIAISNTNNAAAISKRGGGSREGVCGHICTGLRAHARTRAAHASKPVVDGDNGILVAFRSEWMVKYGEQIAYGSPKPAMSEGLLCVCVCVSRLGI